MRSSLHHLASIGVCAALLFSVGCTTRLGDLTVVSTRNVTMGKAELSSLPQVRDVTGKSTRYVLLCIPLGFPHLEDAIDAALDKGNGDLMVDAVISAEGWWFLVGENSVCVKGTVVQTQPR